MSARDTLKPFVSAEDYLLVERDACRVELHHALAQSDATLTIDNIHADVG